LSAVGGRRVIVVTGKGGVGKSTVTAALGWALAGGASGARRVLALEVDPRENVHQLLEVPPSGGEVVAAGGTLCLQNLRPTQVLDGIVRRQVKLEMVARRILASPIYRQFAEGMPGLQELAVLDAAYEHTDAGGRARFDTVVLDAPATGHGVTLLSAPGLVADAIHVGPVAEVAARLAERIADPHQTAMVVVTSAESMAVDEALQLAERLEAMLGRGPDRAVVNGLYPSFPTSWERAARAKAAGPLALWRDRRRVNEHELARLAQGWSGPTVELPLLPLPRGRALVAELAARLADEKGGTR
jgi:anion-transporting  ArsA/GET3 family ATPase